MKPTPIWQAMIAMTLSSVVAVAAVPSHAGVGDCGNPCGNPANPNDAVTATDALVVLQGSIDLLTCIGLVCDVNDNGSVTAGDALQVLQFATSQPVELDCPQDADSTSCPPEHCPCTASGIVDLFKSIHDDEPIGKLQPTPSVALRVECNDLVTPAPTATNPLVISLPDIDWQEEISEIARNQLLFSAVGQHVVFELDPPCYERCLGTCSGGGRDGLECTQTLECGSTCDGTGDSCTTNADCTSRGGRCRATCTGTNNTCSTNGDCTSPATCDLTCGSTTQCNTNADCSAGTCTTNADCTSPATCNLNCGSTGECTTSEECPASGDCTGATCSISEPDECTTSGGCSGGASCSNTTCPGIDSGPRRFLELNGDEIVVDGLSVRGFFEGIQFSGKNDTVRNVTMVRQCDDSISTVPDEGFGGRLESSTITEGCDKCAQLADGASTTYDPGASPRPTQCELPEDAEDDDPNRECYHMSFRDVDLEGCKQPIRVSAGTAQGDNARLYFREVDVTEIEDHTDPDDHMFGCQRTRLSGDDVVADFIDFNSTGCDLGLVLGGEDSVYTVIGESTITLSEKKGLVIETTGDDASTTLRNSEIFDNAGFENSGAPVAGIAIDDGAQASLGTTAGTGADPGDNKICCGFSGDGEDEREVHNRSRTTINALGNYWCDQDPVPVLDDDENFPGSVTNTDSELTSDPFPASGTSCTSRSE